jgi:Ca2+:H+ antiporter
MNPLLGAGGRRSGDGLGISGARKNRLDLSVGIALGSAAQIALFVAPVLVLMVYLIFAITLYLLPPGA